MSIAIALVPGRGGRNKEDGAECRGRDAKNVGWNTQSTTRGLHALAEGVAGHSPCLLCPRYLRRPPDQAVSVEFRVVGGLGSRESLRWGARVRLELAKTTDVMLTCRNTTI